MFFLATFTLPAQEQTGKPAQKTETRVQFMGFPADYWSGAVVSQDEVAKVIDAQWQALVDLHNGIRPYDTVKVEYNAVVYGCTTAEGLLLGDSACPRRNKGHPRWEVMAHEQGHNFFGGTSSFYGRLAFPHPFLQESLAVLSAFYCYHWTLEHRQELQLSDNAIKSMEFDYTNGRRYQEQCYKRYIKEGRRFRVDAVLPSQALDFKMITYGEQWGWDRFRRVAAAFEKAMEDKVTFEDDGVTPEEQSTYIIAALSVAFGMDLRKDFRALNFPIDDTLFDTLVPIITEHVKHRVSDTKKQKSKV
jgi:hypothetical protein